MKRIVTITGIRPDFIRMSLIIKELDEAKVNHILFRTEQHYSYNVDEKFLNNWAFVNLI